MPRISVVMSVYQDKRFLDEAVQSILNRTLEDFELLLVDDGSDDPEPVLSLGKLDRRIRTIMNGENLGVARSSNHAIAQARAPIIARLDADDIASPTRLETLWQAFEKDPSLSLLASNYHVMTETGEHLSTQKGPSDHQDIVWSSLFFNPFCHSSTAYRKSAFDAVKGYNKSFEVAEDYDLFMRILRMGRSHILQEPLVRYRRNSTGLTAARSKLMALLARRIQTDIWRELGPGLPERFDLLRWHVFGGHLDSVEQHFAMLEELLRLFGKIHRNLMLSFPSLKQEEIASLGRRLVKDAQDYISEINAMTLTPDGNAPHPSPGPDRPIP